MEIEAYMAFDVLVLLRCEHIPDSESVFITLYRLLCRLLDSSRSLVRVIQSFAERAKLEA